jgi:hypothetical protein
MYGLAGFYLIWRAEEKGVEARLAPVLLMLNLHFLRQANKVCQEPAA